MLYRQCDGCDKERRLLFATLEKPEQPLKVDIVTRALKRLTQEVCNIEFGVQIYRQIGYLVDEQNSHSARSIILTDTDYGEHPYVFTQFQHIVKHVRGNLKEERLITWSPFDVWRMDRESHGDAPYSWSSYKQEHGFSSTEAVTAMRPCNLLLAEHSSAVSDPRDDHTRDGPIFLLSLIICICDA
jgi:hypothetical protein